MKKPSESQNLPLLTNRRKMWGWGHRPVVISGFCAACLKSQKSVLDTVSTTRGSGWVDDKHAIFLFELELDGSGEHFPHLSENPRVVAFGAKLSRHRWGSILNPLLRTLFNLSFSTTPRPDYEPWRILAKRVQKLDVEEYSFGLMFLASGSVSTAKAKESGLTVSDIN